MSSIAPEQGRPTRGFVLTAFGGPEVLSLVEAPTRQPGPGEVLVDIEATGVNFGDTMIRRGEYLRDQPLSMAPGCEAVGHVSAVGSGVALRVGERVAAWVEAGGAYADRITLPAHRAYPVPDDLPAAAIVAVFLQGVTAWYALHLFGHLEAGETVLVHAAAGGLGGLGLQLAVLAGARVIGTASTREKRDDILAAGAVAALDSRDVDGLTTGVMAATDGAGCDMVLDGVGGPVFVPSLKGLGPRGRYVLAGSSSQEPAMLDARHLLPRNQTVCGFIVARIADDDPAEPSRALLHLCDLVRSGQLVPRYETRPLHEAPEVHRQMERRAVAGKIVLRP
jgi:NADPH2:quinone reductase